MTERYWHDEWEQDKYQLKISWSKQAEISGGANYFDFEFSIFYSYDVGLVAGKYIFWVSNKLV